MSWKYVFKGDHLQLCNTFNTSMILSPIYCRDMTTSCVTTSNDHKVFILSVIIIIIIDSDSMIVVCSHNTFWQCNLNFKWCSLTLRQFALYEKSFYTVHFVTFRNSYILVTSLANKLLLLWSHQSRPEKESVLSEFPDSENIQSA